MNEEARKSFADFYKDQDKNVFIDYSNPRGKTNEKLYGDFASRGESAGGNLYKTDNRISHMGFDSISDFNKAINELKEELNAYDNDLENYQNQIIEVTEKQDFFQKHPERDFTNKTEELTKQEKEIMEQVEKIKEIKQKQLKNLEELEVARKEFMNNKKNTYHEEIKERVGITAEPDANGKIDPKGKYGSIENSILGQLERAKKELKNLDAKKLLGTVNKFEEDRYKLLKNEIIPELEKQLNKTKTITSKDNQEKEENDILEKEENDILEKKENDILEKKDIKKSEDENIPKENQEKKTDETKISTTPEESKKAKNIYPATERVKKKVAKISSKAILAIAGTIAAIALTLANPALSVLALAGLSYNEYNKGKKV